MKITIYTITDCQFSKQEKEYLQSHNLQFEEKNLETNREFLTEMLAISNNFAGTPVTKLVKDDGSNIVLKGFTKDEFDKELGFASVAAAPAPTVGAPAADMSAPAPPPEPPPTVTPEPAQPVTPPAPVEPAHEEPPAMPTTPPMPEPGTPPTVEPEAPHVDMSATTPTEPTPVEPMTPPEMPAPTSTPEPTTPTQPEIPQESPTQQPPAPAQAAQAPGPLDAILTSLQTKSGSNTAPAANTTPPTIPDPNFKSN
jgi:glutaredoxin